MTMTDKIKAALLGDPATAAECTAAGIAIPCPFCGEQHEICRISTHVGIYCRRLRYTVEFATERAALAAWNHRAPIQTEDNPPLTEERFEAICEAVHNGWWEEKKRQGVTDHPYMKPYVDLSEAVKEYDRVTVRRVLDAMGVAYCRRPEGSEER